LRSPASWPADIEFLFAVKTRFADRLETMHNVDLAKPKVMSGAWR